MSDKSNIKELENKVVERAINSDKFRNWFGDSKVVDSSGNPLVMYRGDFRADSIGDSFDLGKASSGRFYFTNDPTIASSYATGKSYVDEDRDYEYYDFFQVKSDKDGKFYNLKDAWKKLSAKLRVNIIKKAKQVNVNDNYDVVTHEDPTSKIPQQQVDMLANRETGRNYLWALSEAFLSSGIMVIEQDDFASDTFEKILEFVGFKPTDVKYDNPRDSRSGVTPVFLRIENPLDTSKDVDEYLYDDLYNEANDDWDIEDSLGKDQWNKYTKTKEEWFDQLANDIENNKTHAWTSIPEPITIALQQMGFDGIKDLGGKNEGSTSHEVWIAFEPEQIKSIYNKGTWDSESTNIMESKKLLREFTDNDANFLDDAFTLWNEVKSHIESTWDSDDEIMTRKITETPLLKKYNLMITFHTGGYNGADGLFGKNKSYGKDDDKYGTKYVISLLINKHGHSSEEVKSAITTSLDRYKHIFVHEFVHYKQTVENRRPKNYSSDDYVKYIQQDIEWEAYLKQMYSEIFHAYKRMQQEGVSDLIREDFFGFNNVEDFIDIWKDYSNTLRLFMENKDKIEPSYKKKIFKKIYKLQQYMKTKL